MAIQWGPIKDNFRLGIDITGSGTSRTMIVYGQSQAYGWDWDGTITFSDGWSGSKAVSFSSAWGATVTKEFYRTTWHDMSGSYTFSVSLSVPGLPGLSNSVSRSITVTPKPTAPRLDGVVRISDTSHRVEWTRYATATSVRLERRTNGGAWQHVASVSSNAASITDTTTKAGNRYQYRVRVSNAGGTSDWSNLSATIYTTPPVPTGVSAARVGDDIRVNGSMPTNSSHLDIQDDGVTVVSALAKGSLPWTHTSPDQAVPHRYRMRSRVNSGTSNSTTLYSDWSVYSATVQLTAPPAAPSNLAPNGGVRVVDDVVRFGWQHNPVDSSLQSEFEVRYRPVGGGWTVVSGGTESFVDVSLPVDNFEWQVRTKGAHPDWSPWSAVATVSVVDQPTVAIASPVPGEVHDATLSVGWTYFQAQGRPQSGWRVRLEADGQVVETREGTGAGSSVVLQTTLEDEHTYTVSVEVATGGIWSEPDTVTVHAVFIPPAPAVFAGVWNEATGAVDVQVSALEQADHDPVVNYAPRIEGDGTWAEVRRNMEIDPSFEGTQSWTQQSSSATRSTEWASTGSKSMRIEGTGARNSSTIYRPLSTWGVETGKTYTAMVRVHLPAPLTGTLNQSALSLSLNSIGFPGAYAENKSGTQDLRFTFTIDGTDITTDSVFRLYHGASAGGGVSYWDDLLVVEGVYDGPYFDGSTPDFTVDPDMRTRWLGTPNESESVMEIERVAGMTASNCVAGVSTWEGKPAVRQIPTSPTSIDSFMKLNVNPTTSPATAMGTASLLAPLTGAVASTGTSIYTVVTVGGAASAGDRDSADNVAGSHSLRAFDSRPLREARWVHGGRLGAGDVWWTDIGLFEGDYQADVFDGDTEWVEIDGVWMYTRWQSDGTSVATSPDDAVSMTVERSVDDGVSWVTIAENIDTGAFQVPDYEAASNGITLYRVTTFAATGAATTRIFPVQADSGAIWVAGGIGYSDTCRLPYNPQVTVTAGRERVAKRYSGRSLPVVYAGEQLSRTVDTGGMILVDDDDAQVTDLERVAQSVEPVHLIRFPDGRIIYGMLSHITAARQSHAHWGYSFTLTETET